MGHAGEKNRVFTNVMVNKQDGKWICLLFSWSLHPPRHLRSGQSLLIFLSLILSLSLCALSSSSKNSNRMRVSKYLWLAGKKITGYEERFWGEGFDLLKLWDLKGGESNDKDHEKEWKEADQEGRRKEAERSEAGRGGKTSLGDHSSEGEAKTDNIVIWFLLGSRRKWVWQEETSALVSLGKFYVVY